MLYKIHINDWEKAISVLKIINKKNPLWAFRGQADIKWGLQTKFEREGEQHDLDTYFYSVCESNVITGFKRQAGQYIQNLPAPQNTLDWLALIQHYGGPTRLLDFTYSFYVATFFAIHNSISDSAVWSLNINYLLKKDSEFSSQIGKLSYQDIIKKYVERLNNFIGGKPSVQPDRSICIVEPFIQEKRLSIQQGLFIAPTNIEKSFHNNLASAINTQKDNFSDNNLSSITLDDLEGINGEELFLLKIILSKDMKYEVVDQLRNMNISDATLFPGIDGFTRSLNFAFHEVKWVTTKPRE